VLYSALLCYTAWCTVDALLHHVLQLYFTLYLNSTLHCISTLLYTVSQLYFTLYLNSTLYVTYCVRHGLYPAPVGRCQAAQPAAVACGAPHVRVEPYMRRA
jgi:hypothetical protein